MNNKTQNNSNLNASNSSNMNGTNNNSSNNNDTQHLTHNDNNNNNNDNNAKSRKHATEPVQRAAENEPSRSNWPHSTGSDSPCWRASSRAWVHRVGRFYSWPVCEVICDPHDSAPGLCVRLTWIFHQLALLFMCLWAYHQVLLFGVFNRVPDFGTSNVSCC